jgi:hypothetical protein
LENKIMKALVIAGTCLLALPALAQKPTFNPDISLILDAKMTAMGNHADEYELPGFQLGGEAGVGQEGFSLGHSELAISSNIDDKFFGKFTVAFAEHEGETELEIEEAFIQTLTLGNGFNMTAGRFFSGIGYQNAQHGHAWAFSDAPLVYAALFGNTLIDDGVQLTWMAPTETYVQFGVEALSGKRFPSSGGDNDGMGAYSAFAKIGDDFSASSSWQLGASYYTTNVEDREGGGHSHGHDADHESPHFTGESQVIGLDAVYKWAPQGNAKDQNITLQAEVFQRHEKGDVQAEHVDASGVVTPEESTLDSKQIGWYAQIVHQFMPQWRWGVRYDHLESDNTGADEHVLEEAGFDDEGISPQRTSVMIDWSNSEFSRVRLQFNDDKSYENSDQQVILQYTMSLGAHGAHSF